MSVHLRCFFIVHGSLFENPNHLNVVSLVVDWTAGKRLTDDRAMWEKGEIFACALTKLRKLFRSVDMLGTFRCAYRRREKNGKSGTHKSAKRYNENDLSKHTFDKLSSFL